jgi:hypothetical protein
MNHAWRWRSWRRADPAKTQAAPDTGDDAKAQTRNLENKWVQIVWVFCGQGARGGVAISRNSETLGLILIETTRVGRQLEYKISQKVELDW